MRQHQLSVELTRTLEGLVDRTKTYKVTIPLTFEGVDAAGKTYHLVVPVEMDLTIRIQIGLNIPIINP